MNPRPDAVANWDDAGQVKGSVLCCRPTYLVIAWHQAGHAAPPLVTLRKRRRMLGVKGFSPSTWTHLAVAYCPPVIMAAKDIAGLVTGWAPGQGWRIRSSPRCKTATEPARLVSSVRLARSLIVLVTVAAD